MRKYNPEEVGHILSFSFQSCAYYTLFVFKIIILIDNAMCESRTSLNCKNLRMYVFKIVFFYSKSLAVLLSGDDLFLDFGVQGFLDS